jgi:hypothetical protein
MLNRGEAQVLLHPERKFYRGTQAQLQAHPEVLMGVNPQEILDLFLTERSVLRNQMRSDFTQAPAFQVTPERYILTYSFPNGTSERFSLRKSDLLVDTYERLYGQQVLSTMRFWAYELVDGRYLLPTDFTGELAQGSTTFSARVSEIRVNEPMPELMGTLTVPDGFERLALARY